LLIVVLIELWRISFCNIAGTTFLAHQLSETKLAIHLSRLNHRLSYKGFSNNRPLRMVATNALSAVQQMHKELLSWSFDVKAVAEPEKPPGVDPLFTRKSALRKDEKIRLGRIQRDTH
jgi:hypothetical protein